MQGELAISKKQAAEMLAEAKRERAQRIAGSLLVMGGIFLWCWQRGTATDALLVAVFVGISEIRLHWLHHDMKRLEVAMRLLGGLVFGVKQDG